MIQKPLRLVFMGSPDFAVPALEALFSSYHQVIAVYTKEPKPKGRGQDYQKTPIHLLAEKNHCPVFTPKSFKNDPQAVKEFQDLKADLAIVAAYGLILPSDILNAPKYGCINIHASLLPRWRGASPIHHAIWKGDDETGITIMKMDIGLDTGDMILKSSVPIHFQTTTQILHDQLAQIGAELTFQVLDQLLTEGDFKAQKQDESLSCYAPLLKKEDGHIDWSHSAMEIDRQIRALNPWPSCFAFSNNKLRFKILEAKILQKTNFLPRLITQEGIICGDQIELKIEKIQFENAKIISFQDALNGCLLKLGDQVL